MKTIFALCTPPINGALHIIRICGPDAFNIINKITLNPVTREGYKMQLNYIIDKDNNQIDEVILVKFVSPHSFTGEDTVEINCHGGMVVVDVICSLLLANNATLAERGEFSRFALINNKIDLTQAEAINDLINSQSSTALIKANQALSGQNNQLVKELKNKLLTLIGTIEVNIDYPEFDDVEKMDSIKLKKAMIAFNNEITTIIENSKLITPIMKGINVAIVGKPNVGKSSLLNAFLNENKAIVSNIAGTTRDIVEGSVNLKGLIINFIDTAGIRNKTSDKIEKIGINKSKEQIKKADLVLLIFDGSKPLDSNDKKLLNLCKVNKIRYLIVINKSDKKNKIKVSGINISCIKGQIEPLIDAILKEFKYGNIDIKKPALQTDRQINLLYLVNQKLSEGIELLNKNEPIDLVADYLQQAFAYLKEIIGENYKEDLLDEIFSKFCLGK